MAPSVAAPASASAPAPSGAAAAPRFVLTGEPDEQPSALEDTDSAIGGSTSTDKGNNR